MGVGGHFQEEITTEERQDNGKTMIFRHRKQELVDTDLKQSSLDYGSLSVSAYLNASERFRKELFEPVTNDFDDDRLTERFSFYRLMRMPVVVTSIVLVERIPYKLLLVAAEPPSVIRSCPKWR
jgi:hypothetical protein